MTDDILQLMLVETNRYAVQKGFGEAGGRPWKDITMVDVLRWFGCLMLMPNYWHNGAHRPYWDSDKFIGLPTIKEFSASTMFEQITRVMSFVDRNRGFPQKGEPGYDPLWKSCPLHTKV